MLLPSDFRFSQSSLQDYVECPRRFQLRYIDQRKWPAVEAEPILERERRMQLGADFHHLVHQHLLGVPASVLTSTAAKDDDLRRWWANYRRDPFIATLPEKQHPEITLSAPVNGHRLLAKYDLIALQPGQQAIIVDWKTSPRKPNRSQLETRLQTVVYRTLLVEAGAALNDGQKIDPEAVEMVYWFAENPANPERFPYDNAQYKQDADMLSALINEIKDRQGFDITTEARRCRFCVYRSLCERGIEAGNEAELDVDFDVDAMVDVDFDFDEIAEIEF